MTLHHDNDVHDKVVVVVNAVIHDVVVVVVVTSLTLSLTGRLRWSCHLDDFLLVVIVNAMTTFTTAYINVVIVVDLVITRSSSSLSRVMTV